MNNREIKFRAWDKVKNKMWTVHTWSNPTLITLEWTKENYQKQDKSPQTETHNWKDKYILMQYTGLKDKNGKEIYEGDIVKSGTEFNNYTGLDCDLYGGNIYEVKNNGWRFYLEPKSIYE